MSSSASTPSIGRLGVADVDRSGAERIEHALQRADGIDAQFDAVAARLFGLHGAHEFVVAERADKARVIVGRCDAADPDAITLHARVGGGGGIGAGPGRAADELIDRIAIELRDQREMHLRLAVVVGHVLPVFVLLHVAAGRGDGFGDFGTRQDRIVAADLG